jgi:hypothetical protein
MNVSIQVLLLGVESEKPTDKALPLGSISFGVLKVVV